jgi:regulator of PEP synthase PpsR (kinase-PPPase family)
MTQSDGAPPLLTVYVVSDATGETAERVTRSALTQFGDAPVTIVRRGGVRTSEQVRRLVAEAAGRDCVIIHTMVSNELRQEMLEEARLHGVDAMDVMGPVLDRLATHLHLTPQEKPGLFTQLVEAQSRRIEAVEFAFRHDDGQRVEEVDRAEIVLVGVSRTMKTPTMLYLAYRGWFAANIPIVRGVPPPRPLGALPIERVFGLTMSVTRLAELRRVRAAYLGIAETGYASLEEIRGELAYSHDVCRAQGWRTIDVTGKSVEEVAREILVLGRYEVSSAEGAP